MRATTGSHFPPRSLNNAAREGPPGPSTLAERQRLSSWGWGHPPSPWAPNLGRLIKAADGGART